MAAFRNGMRVVDAYQTMSGDWVVYEGKREYLQEDGAFRTSWEPWDEEARRMWQEIDAGVRSRSRRGRPTCSAP